MSWKGVISGVAIPTRSISNHLERDLQAVRQAMAWLTRPSADLTEVCEMAGFEVSSILAGSEQFLAGEFEFMELSVASH